jgi:starvation-inducible DNA-binding protein
MAIATKNHHPNSDVKTATRELSAENSADSPVVQSLRRQTANAFMLYLNYKHYHWQAFGPMFRDLHKLFDQLAHEVLETVDPLAERVRMIGQDPPTHLIEIADLATVAPAGRHATVREMIEEADRHALLLVRELREGAKTADSHGDPGTVDLMSRVVQVHEKHEWWLRDMLRKRDGLTS